MVMRTNRWPYNALIVLTLLLLGIVPAPDAAASSASDSIAEVVAKVSPSVVRIISVRPPAADDEKSVAQVANASMSNQMTTAFGSGFIIDPSGFIATNKHVADKAIALFVVTAAGERYQARVVGMPGKVDMALLRIDAGRDLPAVQFGDSDKMRVGDTVIAIGSPFGFDNSVTAGILSAVNRDIMESPFDDYLQTDAAINHGNSGGPLFNLAGEVIGMNSVIFAPGAGSVGLGFALPSNDLQFVFGRLMKMGEVRAGMLPIHTQQVSWMLQQALNAPSLQGALVSAVQDEHEIMMHGKIQPGDVIISFNGQKIWDPRDLARKAAQEAIGSDVALEIDRGGKHETVHVDIQAWPDMPPSPVTVSPARKLGLELSSSLDPDGHSIVTVASVDQNGTAADSGIQKGDTILEVQRIPVSEPDQALRIFSTQSSTKHAFAAVLIEHEHRRTWMPIAIPSE